MKSAYELAMERLNKTGPTVTLTPEKKKELAELDSLYASKIAQREILVRTEIAQSEAKGDWDAVEQLKKQIISDRKSLQSELEEKKEKARGS